MVPIYCRGETPRHTGRMPGKVSGKLLELSENTLLRGLNTQPWLYFVTVALGSRCSGKRRSKKSRVPACAKTGSTTPPPPLQERSLNLRQVRLTVCSIVSMRLRLREVFVATQWGCW